MDKDLDIQIEEALKAYLASGVEEPGEWRFNYSTGHNVAPSYRQP